jgi:hypothetical protein
MRSKNQKKNGNKEEKRLYYCSLCPFVAETYEELDLHYSLSHDEPDDISYELEMMLENKKTSRKKKKDLKSKAIEQLLLMVEGISYKNEYVGWCETKYELYSKKMGNNKYIIELVPRITVC